MDYYTPTGKLRYVTRRITIAAPQFNPGAHIVQKVYVLQQEWVMSDDPYTEWRDVPTVDEEQTADMTAELPSRPTAG